ncbi:MAG: efflux RND transporter periplasmic adaptor subunit [Nitrosomonadales bacterium]|nr:MAG: efflux RND transporter periplasmic adaptor subunit [Nitrosomonadales bacterium]
MKKIYLLLAAALLLPACARKEADKPQAVAPPASLISVAQAQTKKLEIYEQTVGTMEGLIDPHIGAEVPARVVQVLAHAGQDVKNGQLLAVLDAADYALQKREAQAEIGRIEALLSNQGKIVDRNQRLVQKNFISRNALDDASAQQDALRQQMEGAKAQLATIEHNSAKTRVISPIDGRVEKQIVAPGDFVKVGDPLFQLIGTTRLRAHLPFPESVAAKLHSGQTVRLSTPTVPDKVFTTTIKEIKPLIGSGNRAADVIADVVDQAGWQPGASVNGIVVLGEHAQAVVVPEASVVLRPAGEVVYAIKDKTAQQRMVKTGLRQEGLVEIVEGLAAGETVAVDGAGYLTDKALVNVQQSGAK